MTDMMPATGAFNESGYAGVGFGLGVAVTKDVAATGLARHRRANIPGAAPRALISSTTPKRRWRWCS